MLAFQGATKRNRPNLKPGAVVYAKVEEITKFMRTQITCISNKRHKGWTTGQSLFGELKSGNVFSLPIKYCVQLKKFGKPLIFKQLRDYVSFEIAIGVNGKVWIDSHHEKNVIVIYNIIKKCQYM